MVHMSCYRALSRGQRLFKRTFCSSKCSVTQACFVGPEGQLRHEDTTLKQDGMVKDYSYPMGYTEEASVYIHWPYCAKRCTYCNFNKYISSNVDHVRMRNCLAKEAKTLLEFSGVKKIRSVFFGGGTPSLAEPLTIETVLNALSEHAYTPANMEVTLEVNPTTLEAGRLRDFQDAGVSRVSIGVQTLDDGALQTLGREHSSEDSIRCLELAKNLFPGQTSLDLIFGHPGHSLQQWTKELDKIMLLCDDHIALYQLTLERGTALFKKVIQEGSTKIPSSDEMADMYQAAVELLERSGFHRYEASNFAKSERSESSHNKHYWQGGQYLGIGPGAHGRFVPREMAVHQREARIQTLEPMPWMTEVERFGHATRKRVPQSQQDVAEEVLVVGLRTKQGIPHKRWSLFSPDANLYEIFGTSEEVDDFVKTGFLSLSDRGLMASSKGINVIDSITPVLMNVLDEHYRKEQGHNVHDR